MPSNIRMRGTGGELKVGYQVAARLGSWDIAHDVLTSPGAKVDPFWSGEPGSRSLRLVIGNTVWTWNDVRVSSYDPLTVDVSGTPDRRSM